MIVSENPCLTKRLEIDFWKIQFLIYVRGIHGNHIPFDDFFKYTFLAETWKTKLLIINHDADSGGLKFDIYTSESSETNIKHFHLFLLPTTLYQYDPIKQRERKENH